jgi:hypothetical protein
MMIGRGRQNKNREKGCSISTLSTTNLTQRYPELNLELCDDKSTSNFLSYGMAN